MWTGIAATVAQLQGAPLGALAAGLLTAVLARLLAPALAQLWSWLCLARRLQAAFPGPRPWPLLGNIPQVGFDLRTMIRHMIGISIPHSPVSCNWIGPLPCLCLGDPRDIELVMGSLEHVEKPFIYRLMENWLGHGLITAPKAVWRQHRRLLEPAFHSRLLAQFVPVFCRQTEVWLRQLQKNAGAAAFDIQPSVELLTLDNLCESAMGVTLNVQSNSKHEFAVALKEVEEGVIERILRPWLYWDWLYNLSGLGRRIRRALAVVHGTRDRVVQARRRELQQERGRQGDRSGPEPSTEEGGEAGRGRGRLALLDLLLRTEQLSERAVAEQVDTFMMAGHSTTAFTLGVTLYLLSQHPHEQERVAAEVEAVFGPDRPPEPSAEQLGRLGCMDRVLKEAQRLYPAVMVLLRQAGRDIPLISRDSVIPAGCMVLVCPEHTHKDPALYPDPDRFDPDRWLPENSRDRHPYSYFPFSGGPRNCIGRRFARLEIKTALSKLLWQYQLLPEPGFELQTALAVISELVSGCRLRLVDRRHGPA